MTRPRRSGRDEAPPTDEFDDDEPTVLDEYANDLADVPDDWRDLVEDKLSRLKGQSRTKDADDLKTLDEVFDKQTLLTLWKFISNGLIDTLDYPLSTGKEANVFHATARDGGSVAVKIFRTNTATFRSFTTYIHGDPRFGKVGRERRDIVHVWTQKEYKNLQRYFDAQVRVPQPLAYRHNVLLMEFVGTEGTPAPLAKDLLPADPQVAYDDLVEQYRRGFDAGLVHGDLSEFNLLNHDGELIIIDVAQAVLTRHPMARELLERDAKNVARWFKRLGVKTSPKDALDAFVRREQLKADDGVDGDGSS